MRLEEIPGRYAVCRLGPGQGAPWWAQPSEPIHIVARTPGELTVVCEERLVPEGVRCERGFRALRVAEELDFQVVGVLAALTAPLAAAGIPILAYATFDTDYLLLPSAAWDDACDALRDAGHVI